MRRQCNFSIQGGPAAVTNQYQIGFYGLTVMPIERHRVMGTLTLNHPTGYPFFDDIIIATNGSRSLYFQQVKSLLSTINDAGAGIKLEKFAFWPPRKKLARIPHYTRWHKPAKT